MTTKKSWSIIEKHFIGGYRMNKIIIVESPSKSKTISGYLGGKYTVLSSKGHICDLATTGKGGLGIDIDNGFIPDYRIIDGKESLVKSLQKACKGNQVYLATDPDREGEAIAYHLARELNLDLNDLNRIEFHEITKQAVNDALLHPHTINMKMVDSQESRRMIDRILGFKLSKLLQRKIGSKSAGRVQSATLLLIVNLEKEIQAFIPEAYYEMEAIFKAFKLKISEINGVKIDSKNRIKDRKILEDLKSRLLSFTVSDISKKQIKKQSYPTYTTSTMQQDASIRLGFSPTKTMSIAQALYEGKNIGSETVGLITYMRTDSTRLSDSFVKSVEDYILNTYGTRYLGSVKTKNQKGMQDAHEGIRPTSISRTPDSLKPYLTNDEYKLYNLIYKRTLASLMSAAVFNQTKVEFTNTDSLWTTQGSELTFDGYLKVYGKEEEESDFIPNFALGDSYNADKINILDKETQPKSRYTEASLIKDMEDLGIGRPSTYAQTIATLKEREYIKLEKRMIHPTEQGILTIDKLNEYFDSIINVKYTANMESDLDKIASGDLAKEDELTSFYQNFMPIYDKALKNMESKYPIPTDEICPECGSPLVIRLGKYGEFTSCSNYPNCNYIKKEVNEEDNDTGIVCPVCHKAHIVKRISKSGKNKGSIFYACDNYPKCKTIFNDMPTSEVCDNCGSLMLKDKDGNLYCSNHCMEEPKEVFICPECGKGHLVARTAARGKNKGNTFYGCTNFPKCKVIIEDTPTHEVCPKCGSMMLKDKDGILYCYRKCSEAKAPIVVDQTKEVLCPECGKGHLVARTAGKGKNKGNTFFGCSRYPRCKRIVSLEEYNNLRNK